MTMKHLTHEELNAYLDGEVSASEQATIESHLAECAECSAELEQFQSVKNLMGSLTEVDVPRSFALPAEFGKIEPISSPASPSAPSTGGSGKGNLTRFEPVARILSIAAVLAFLVLGGGQVAGLFGDDANDTNTNNTELVGDSETNTESSALENAEPALERGELREQGDSAATGAGSLTTNLAPVDTAQQADEGLTALEITTIGVGVVALAAIASWILIHYRAGTVS